MRSKLQSGGADGGIAWTTKGDPQKGAFRSIWTRSATWTNPYPQERPCVRRHQAQMLRYIQLQRVRYPGMKAIARAAIYPRAGGAAGLLVSSAERLTQVTTQHKLTSRLRQCCIPRRRTVARVKISVIVLPSNVPCVNGVSLQQDASAPQPCLVTSNTGTLLVLVRLGTSSASRAPV